MSKRAVDETVTDGGENVFADLALSEPQERLAKAELARAVRRLVLDRGWTQARGAKAIGIPASDMSDLMRGKLARFSQERIEDFLTRLGMDVQIRVTPSKTSDARGTISVKLVGAR